MTSAQEFGPVRVSRQIGADAATIFAVLADPRRHTDLDGSGMLRGSLSDVPVTGAGDVFVLKMYHPRHGDYEMANQVVDFERERRIAWEPRRHDIDAPPWGHRWGYELSPNADGTTIVTEFYDCSRAPEEDRIQMQNGRIWIEAMTSTLERLDKLCTDQPAPR